MSRWFPSKIEIQKWIEDQENDFAEAQNKNPGSSPMPTNGSIVTKK
jgi:hypothetical protein